MNAQQYSSSWSTRVTLTIAESLLFLFCVAKSHLYAFKRLHTSLLEVLGPVYMGPPPPYEQALRAQRIYAKITWYLSPDNWTYNWLYDVSKIENQSQSLSLLIRHRDSDSFLYGILLAATLCLWYGKEIFSNPNHLQISLFQWGKPEKNAKNHETLKILSVFHFPLVISVK